MTEEQRNVLADYLLDLGAAVKQRAYEAREEKRAATETGDTAYQIGRLMAFNEVVTIMQLQADAFGIPRTALSLEDVEPDKDLI